jgi:hypothetical protein
MIRGISGRAGHCGGGSTAACLLPVESTPVLCLHTGGHVFKAEWLEDAYRWVIELQSVPPAGASGSGILR